MRCKMLNRVVRRLFRIERNGIRTENQSSPSITIDPLTVGLRVQTRHRTGAGTEFSVSRMIWISPMGSDPENLKSLRIQVVPN